MVTLDDGLDFEVRNHGTIILFTPLTDEARQWLEEHVASEPYQWFDGSLSVDHRYAPGLREQIDEAGFRAEVV